jgi:hypothetical protein
MSPNMPECVINPRIGCSLDEEPPGRSTFPAGHFPVLRSYLVGAGTILLLTAVLKLPTVLGEAPWLGTKDAIVQFLSRRQTLFAAAVLEIAVATLALRAVKRDDASSKGQACGAIAWLSALFLTYRLGLQLTGSTASCHCLGTVSAWLASRGPLNTIADALLTLLLVCLLIPAAIVTLRAFFREKSSAGWAAIRRGEAVGVLLAAGIACANGSPTETPVEPRTNLVFTAKGFVSSHYLRSDYRFTNQFVFSFSNCQYKAQLLGGRPKEPQLLGIECIFDGTDLFLIHQLATNFVGTRGRKLVDGTFVELDSQTPVTQTDCANVRITEGSRPPVETDGITLLWLAFAAYCHYPVSDREESPLFFMGWFYDNQKLKVSVDWRLDSSPGFLRQLSQFHPGKRYVGNNGRVVALPLRGPFASGYTNAHYAVLEWMSVRGLNFPHHFLLRSLMPDASGEGLNTLVVCEGYTVEVTTGSIGADFSAHLPPGSRIREQRRRLTGIDDEFTYFSQSGAVLDSKGLQLRPDFGHQGAFSSSSVSPLRRLMLALLAAVFASPLAFLFLRRKRLRACLKSKIFD